MALFIGPKLEYVWKHKTSEEFEGFGYSGIKEELHPINISSVIGLGVNIANIFFDFRYEIGLTNISKSIIVSIRPRACFFPLFSFLPLWLHYNLNPLCVQY